MIFLQKLCLTKLCNLDAICRQPMYTDLMDKAHLNLGSAVPKPQRGVICLPLIIIHIGGRSEVCVPEGVPGNGCSERIKIECIQMC